jgi:class 3 adenylate cyclase/TolB-like protein
MTSTERKMAAIIAMDVTSYSEKMGRDEEGTLKHLRACREIIETVVAENRGRIFNTAGDAFMIEFSSAVSALSAAVEIQKLIKNRNESLEEIERMYFRMGVNVGDIIIEGDNLYGEGVNIAARLEGIAAPGGISISEKVYAEVRKKFNFVFEDKGHQELKNIDDPVRVYELNTDAVGTSGGISSTSRKKTAAQNSRNMIILGVSVLLVAIAAYFFIAQKGILKSSEPSKLANTILFLPVETLSKDDLAKNLAFGLTQDLHSSLSRATGLNIIKVPKKPDDLTTLTKQSEAQYVIDSSLMQSGENFRLTVNLMNTTTMASIWSKTYEKKMSASDIFSTQDEIVKNLVQELSTGGFINAAMMKDISSRSIAKGTDNSSAYECVNLSKYQWVSGDFSKSLKIMKCLKEATQLDPNYADAWASLANAQIFSYSNGQLGVDVLNEALANADRAIALDPKNATYHSTKSGVYQLQRKWELMFAESDKAIELAPNDAEVVSGVVLTYIASGECTDKQRADFNAAKGTYTTGLCQWQKGFEAGLKADLLDKANSFPLRHYPMANLYLRSGQWDNALDHLKHITYPGEFFYEFFSALAMHGKGNKEQATKHFDAIKKTLGSSKLSDLQVPLKKWDWGESSETLKPLFISYGFN